MIRLAVSGRSTGSRATRGGGGNRTRDHLQEKGAMARDFRCQGATLSRIRCPSEGRQREFGFENVRSRPVRVVVRSVESHGAKPTLPTTRRLAPLERPSTAAARTRPPHDVEERADAIAKLRCALEGDDGQVLTPAAMPDAEFDDAAWLPSNECLRSSTHGSPRPPRPRFESRLPARGHRPGVHLVGRGRTEKGERPPGGSGRSRCRAGRERRSGFRRVLWRS
jgi:hypothetical protein